ncbi:MAG TPA: hypothetical protein PKC39_14805 [Ferruginibacter sp.]|nr:hypothetical protein [Ferruginibacter sp.]HMP22227.1 hypothetical protein [Ferruginibacter sp.]
MNQLLLITLAVLQLAVFLILMLGKLFIRSIDPKGNIYSIDKWDKALIGAVILCIGVTASLFVAQSSAVGTPSATADTLQAAAPVIPKQVLRQYGYELDTSSAFALALRDSLQVNTLVVKEAQPGFGLSQQDGIHIDSITANRFFLQLKFYSEHAPVKGVIVRSIPALFIDETLRVPADAISNYFYFPVGEGLPADSARTVHINIPHSNKGIIYCLLTGVVTGANGQHNYSIRKIYWLDIETRQYGQAADAHFKLIDNLYRRQGFN